MGRIICLAGAAGALLLILLIVIRCLMGKKAYVPLSLLALCVAAVLMSGQFLGPSGAAVTRRSPVRRTSTAARTVVRPSAPGPSDGADQTEPAEDAQTEPSGGDSGGEPDGWEPTPVSSGAPREAKPAALGTESKPEPSPEPVYQEAEFLIPSSESEASAAAAGAEPVLGEDDPFSYQDGPVLMEESEAADNAGPAYIEED